MSSSDSAGDISLPQTPQDVLQLVEACSSLDLIASTLVPTLQALTTASSGGEASKSRQRTASDDKKTDELLEAVHDQLGKDDIHMRRYTALMVYTLYVWRDSGGCN